MSQQVTNILPRQVTDDEVGMYQRNGWVKLDGLFSAPAVAALLAIVAEKMGTDANRAVYGASPMLQQKARGEVRGNKWAPLSVDGPKGNVAAPTFYHLSHSPEMGRLGERLVGRPVRYFVDEAFVKLPYGGSEKTPWHTDLGAQATSPFDRTGQFQLWVALDEVPPERGAMRFVPPDKIDDEVRRIGAEASLGDSYREFETRGILSPQLHYQPGDATVHGSQTFHSAPPNSTERPRWGYVVSLFPADARFTGRDYWPTEGVDGMVVGETFPDHRFPVL